LIGLCLYLRDDRMWLSPLKGIRDWGSGIRISVPVPNPRSLKLDPDSTGAFILPVGRSESKVSDLLALSYQPSAKSYY